MNFWKSISELRKNRYDDLRIRYPYVFEWKWYSYRRFKLRLYVEASSFLAYFLIRLRVKPDYITAVYALMGLSGGIFLSIPSKITVCIAAFFYYFRGIIDWTDGIVARVNKQASINGTVFDSYGAHVGWIFLWMGLGIYLGHSTSKMFYFLSPLIPTLFAADLYSNARDTLISHRLLHNSTKRDIEDTLKKEENARPTKLHKIKAIIDKIFEHNTRTVDLIIFMILLETFTEYRVMWIFYSFFLNQY